ncbi:MAG: ABC transporter permease [Defluviitoga tunisiensis]
MELVKKIFAVREFTIFLVLIVLMLFLGITAKGFLSVANIFTIILNVSFIGVMACGMTMVIITGGIDLSAGSILGLSGVVMGLLMHDFGVHPLASVLSGFLVGVLCGLVNGFLITKIKIPPFISTLGMLSIARGLAYVLSGGWPISPFPQSFTIQGQGMVGPIPVPVLYFAGVAIIAYIFLRYTIVGRRIYATGGNLEAAKLVGIKTDRILMLVYIINGLLAAFAGFLMTAWLGVAQANAGQGYELDVIAATVIGGTSLQGGEGTILGTVIGAIIMGVLRNGLILLGVSSFWQQVAIGSVIIIAVAFDQLRGGKES